MTQTKMAWIINAAAYDRVLYALTVAAMAAARFTDVSVLFTYGAVRRLVREQTDIVGAETPRWIRNEVTSGIEQGTMKPISEMITFLKGFGGTLYACSASLLFHHIPKDELLDDVDDAIGIATFLEQTAGATLLYV
jgi:peroxiredoxin family protein